MFSEDKSLATIVGTVVLTMAGVLFWLVQGNFGSVLNGDARIAAAIIYGCFTMFGLVLSMALQLFASWLKERKQRRRVATALLAETIPIASLIASALDLTNSNPDYFNRYPGSFVPPPATVFQSLSGQLVLLPPSTVSLIVVLHGVLAGVEISTAAGSIGRDGQLGQLRHQRTRRHAWKHAAEMAVAALGALQKEAGYKGTDLDTLGSLLAELKRGISEAGWPKTEER